MEKQIAILRGINVGGKRKILMADLKTLLASLGFEDIQTYIQSGNVLFNHPHQKPAIETANQIKEAIQDQYGFDVPVMVISRKEMQEAIQQNPFFKDGESDIKTLHLTVLKTLPDENRVATIQDFDAGDDQFQIIGKWVFIYCAGKYHKSKLTNQFFEKKLNVEATTRNWKTVLKLSELSAGD